MLLRGRGVISGLVVIVPIALEVPIAVKCIIHNVFQFIPIPIRAIKCYSEIAIIITLSMHMNHVISKCTFFISQKRYIVYILCCFVVKKGCYAIYKNGRSVF